MTVLARSLSSSVRTSFNIYRTAVDLCMTHEPPHRAASGDCGGPEARSQFFLVGARQLGERRERALDHVSGIERLTREFVVPHQNGRSPSSTARIRLRGASPGAACRRRSNPRPPCPAPSRERAPRAQAWTAPHGRSNGRPRSRDPPSVTSTRLASRSAAGGSATCSSSHIIQTWSNDPSSNGSASASA